MPKKSKTSEEKSSAAPPNGVGNGQTSPAPTKTRTPRKRPSPTPAKAKKRAARVSDDDIRTRAYFISEMRARLSLPGDAHSDWVEARRQLLEETGEA